MGQAKPLILVGTEDIDFYLFVDHVLQAESLATQLAGSLEEIQRSAVELKPDAILLDCRRRAHLAAQICTPLKQNALTSNIPIVALIDQSAERYYVDLMKSGVDDIFIRPILPSKLIECVRAILPGHVPASDAAEARAKAVRYADVEMDLITYRVRRDGRDVHLSPIEFKLLKHFLERPGAGHNARGAAQRCLAGQCARRAAYGGRPCRPAAQGAALGLQGQSDPHGPVGRLRIVGACHGQFRTGDVRLALTSPAAS